MSASNRAKFGAAAYQDFKGKLPNAFPRVMGPNCAKYLQEVVDSGLTVDMITRFEQAFARQYGVKFCVAAPGCTNAMLLLGEAMNLQPGDEVICSSVTDYGDFMGMIKKNYIPVFADTEPGSPNISARTIQACLSDRTRAVICTHKTGLVCDMDPIVELGRRHNLLIIEDACQAVFSRYKGCLAGTLGHVGAFSFDSEKTMGSDIGGCLITNDDKLAEFARFIGQSRGAEQKPGFGRLHTVAGQALRMANCTAAICLGQMEIIEEQVRHIDRIVRLLFSGLAAIPGITPTPIPDYQDVYSCWMAAFSIDPAQFTIGADQFGQECAAAGLTGASVAPYYHMPDACTFLEANARAGNYPYCLPTTTRQIHYAGACPNARAFLKNWVRWATISARYQPEHAEMCVEIVRSVAERNRR